MLEIQAVHFVEAISRIQTLQATITSLSKAHAGEMGNAIGGVTRTNALQGLKIISESCPAFGGRLTKVAADRMLEDIKQGTCSYADFQTGIIDIRNRLLDELTEAKLFALNPEDANFYDGAIAMFGDAVVTAFPSTAAEIDEAGKCLALERVAATIFHLMRVVEVALRSLAPSLGIIEPNPSWNTVIRKIDKELKLQPKDRTLQADYAFLEDVSAQMHAVNKAWRTRAMHVDATFSPQNARDIFNATKALMQHLATELSEPSSAGGAPPA